MASLIWRTFI